MATCGDCIKFCKCYDYNTHLQTLNEDHEICERYEERLEHPNRYIHNGVECFDMLEATLSPREELAFTRDVYSNTCGVRRIREGGRTYRRRNNTLSV